MFRQFLIEKINELLVESNVPPVRGTYDKSAGYTISPIETVVDRRGRPAKHLCYVDYHVRTPEGAVHQHTLQVSLVKDSSVASRDEWHISTFNAERNAENPNKVAFGKHLVDETRHNASEAVNAAKHNLFNHVQKTTHGPVTIVSDAVPSRDLKRKLGKNAMAAKKRLNAVALVVYANQNPGCKVTTEELPGRATLTIPPTSNPSEL